MAVQPPRTQLPVTLMPRQVRFTRTERDATLLLGLDDEGTLEEGRTVGSCGFCS